MRNALIIKVLLHEWFFFDFFAIVEDYVEGSNISSIFLIVGIAVFGTFCLRIS